MKPSNDNEKLLLDLAQELERELGQPDSDRPEGSTGSEMSINCLSVKELNELEAIKEALLFLKDAKQAKEDLNQFQPETRTLVAPIDSTHHSEDRSRTESPADNSSDLNAEFRSIGRYEIIHLIGEGGFAKVFLARDPSLDRHVALKIPKPGRIISEEAQSRFRREAHAAAMLSHPAIVPVFEAGEEGPILWLASGYCEGTTLSEWAVESKQSPTQIAKVVRKLAEAIHHAHMRGVVHRDLKPENILVANGTGCVSERVQITDFGLAKHVESDESTLTLHGAVLGTPAYMSPEQARGDRNCDARTDIFSLGVILYELLTGNKPFSKSTHIATLKAIEAEDPPIPNNDSGKLSRDLQAICMKCLNKRADDRYATAFELANDLDKWLNGQLVTARIPGVLERSWNWCRRNPIPSIALTVTSLAFVFALVQWNKADQNLRLAKMESLKATRNINTAQNTVKEMVTSISTSSRIPADFQQDLVQRAIKLQSQLLADDPDNRDIRFETALSYLAMGIVLADTREYESALEMLDTANEILERYPLDSCTSVERNAKNRITVLRADYLLTLGRTELALQLLDAHDANPKNYVQKSTKLCKKARALQLDNRLNEALVELHKARMLLKLGNSENIFVQASKANILKDLGILNYQLENLNEAKEFLSESIELNAQVGEQISFHESLVADTAQTYKYLGMTQIELDDVDEAQSSLTKATEFYDYVHEYNNNVVRYAIGRIESRLLQIEIQLGRNDWQKTSQLLTECDTIFAIVPKPKSDESVMTARFNSDKLGIVASILGFHIEVSNRWLPIDEAKANKHLAKANDYHSYLEAYFPEAEETQNFRHLLDQE